MPIFVAWFPKGSQHRGELFSFDPQENLENSMLYGKKSESCSSCSSIYTAFPVKGSAHIYTCRCELIFILYTTGIPGPSCKGCQEGSHSWCIYKFIMATFEESIRVYKFNRQIGLLVGLNNVLKIYIKNHCKFSDNVVTYLIYGEHQERLRHHGIIDFDVMMKTCKQRLKQILPINRPSDFEELYQIVQAEICNNEMKLKGIGPLTLYDISLRIGFLYENPLLPEDKVYIQAGALEGIKNLSQSKCYGHLIKLKDWETGCYKRDCFYPAFDGLASMYIEDYLCVFHKELTNLQLYSVRDLQKRIQFYSRLSRLEYFSTN